MSAFSALICLALGDSVNADTDRRMSQDEALGLITTVNIDVSDEVSDRCWTNASSIEAKLRLLFEQNEIKVEKDELAFLVAAARSVSVRAWGYRTGSVCVVGATFALRHWASSNMGGIDGLPEFSASGLVVAFSNSAVLSSKVNANQQLMEFFESNATNLVADIISARRSDVIRLFKNTYPHYGQEIPTQKEWEEYLSDFSSRN
ncbi:MAG TPA: hypothetical protein DCS45_02200 [Roseovarius nubinhibens]|uniref:Uncharacterized protein n=2 Tax=Roseovarius nubinhibens TaxID=314263 RepID=A0A348W812_9RHOB|nr:hypothetical protein [Roseovarius nubinhibens]|tara:strand:- start:65 stop:676 length:612 start_codon:yes stop_codon:yes gene_type:complete